ncbi:hypothetical protein J6590_015706 [Homalodisca vitripennis]|nr:hypothetical protein J6590_015706 [Homalodisca vitripennis]
MSINKSNSYKNKTVCPKVNRHAPLRKVVKGATRCPAVLRHTLPETPKTNKLKCHAPLRKVVNEVTRRPVVLRHTLPDAPKTNKLKRHAPLRKVVVMKRRDAQSCSDTHCQTLRKQTS